MPNPTTINFNNREGFYFSCWYLKDLQKKDPRAFDALKQPDQIWHTVYHHESDFSEPIIIRKGCGLVNRMGFLLAPPDFIPENELYLAQKKHRQLQDNLREAETVS